MLSLTSKFGGLFAAAALAIGVAGAAPAATLTWSALPAVSTGNPLATLKKGNVVENDATDIIGGRLGPWAGTPEPQPGTSQIYTSVSGVKSFAEYSFGGLFKTLTFVWGSPDKFNRVQFFRDGTLIDTILGFGNGDNIALPTVLAKNIGDNKGFDTVRFFDIKKVSSFEYSNIAVAAIPVPAAGLLLLTALGSVAMLRRRMSA